MLNVRIWVEGAVLEYEPCCVAKTPGKILTTYKHTGGAPGCRYKGKSCVGNSMGRRLRGAYAKKGFDVLAEVGGEVRIRRRQDAVSSIWDQF